MDEYSEVGRQKIEYRARKSATSVRCPRDSAIMSVIGCVAKRTKQGKVVYHEFQHVPTDRQWTVKVLSLQCPACRRRLDGLFLGCAEDQQEDTPALEYPDYSNSTAGDAGQLSLRFRGA